MTYREDLGREIAARKQAVIKRLAQHRQEYQRLWDSNPWQAGNMNIQIQYDEQALRKILAEERNNAGDGGYTWSNGQAFQSPQGGDDPRPHLGKALGVRVGNVSFTSEEVDRLEREKVPPALWVQRKKEWQT